MVKLFQGDCLELMKNIPDNIADMILCDLPYGTTRCKWDSIIPFEPLWQEYNRIIKDNAAIVLFAQEPFATKLRSSNLKMYKYDWIWQKPQGTNFLNAKNQPLKNYEIICVFGKKNCDISHVLQKENLIHQVAVMSVKRTVEGKKLLHIMKVFGTQQAFKNLMRFRTQKDFIRHRNQLTCLNT
jgi:DNA modification methylase|nr:MAG TPA: adenine-specific methyltransferase [Caudoviricetes sp.]